MERRPGHRLRRRSCNSGAARGPFFATVLYFSMRRDAPGQRLLFEPPDLAETIRELPAWPDSALKRLGRAIGAELAKRKKPAPLALELGLRMHGKEIGLRS